MTNIRSFRELKVWQRAMDATMRIFTLTKSWPVEERYSLTDQLRRSSRSVPSNIAEAWRKRRYPAAFVAKLNDAEAEAAESQTHLEMAKRCGLLRESEAAALDNEYDKILAMLVSMASHSHRWTIRQPKTTSRLN